MKRTRFGDVFEVQVGAQLAYVQYTQHERHLGDIVRVFTRLYDKRPNDLTDVSLGRSFCIFYPVKDALKPPPLIELVSRNRLSDEDLAPVCLREGSGDIDGKGHWTLYVNGKIETVSNLTEQQRTWPTVYWMMSHQGLLGMIYEANGLAPAPAEQSKDNEGKAFFFLFFARKGDATSAIQKSPVPTFEHQIERLGRKWVLTFSGLLTAPLSDVLAQMESLAKQFNGVFDGFEAPGEP